MPVWYLIVASLAGLSLLSIAWSPLRLALPLLLLATVSPVALACLGAARARFSDEPGRWAARVGRRLLTAALHLAQPLARLRGRLKEGLTPWRQHGDRKSTRLNSSHLVISYAVFCLKKKKKYMDTNRTEIVQNNT